MQFFSTNLAFFKNAKIWQFNRLQFFVLSRWQDGGQRRGGDDWGGGSERRRKDRLQRYVPTSSMAAHFNKVTSQTSCKRTPLCVQLSLFPWVHSLYGDEIVQNMIKSITEDFFLTSSDVIAYVKVMLIQCDPMGCIKWKINILFI